MKKQYDSKVELGRIKRGPFRSKKGRRDGAFLFQALRGQHNLKVIVSDGFGWDHVSVSHPNRCPTWEEMCMVKDLFFEPWETVIQFHVPAAIHINNHATCLHMWRPNNGQEFPLPPPELVGVPNIKHGGEQDG